MKALIIIGILLLISGFYLGYSGSKPLTSLSKTGEVAYQALIILGVLSLGGASVMYLNKQA